MGRFSYTNGKTGDNLTWMGKAEERLSYIRKDLKRQLSHLVSPWEFSFEGRSP